MLESCMIRECTISKTVELEAYLSSSLSRVEVEFRVDDMPFAGFTT